MDGFQHEAGMLREVAGGLEERLAALPDWSVYCRTGVAPQTLSDDPRFRAWQSCHEALDALTTHYRQRTAGSVEAESETQPSWQASDHTQPQPALVPVTAAPRQAFSHQVAAVEVIRKEAPPTDDTVPAVSHDRDEPGAPTEGPTAVEPQGPGAPDISDDLTRVRGINRDLARQLNALGVYRISQIANWTAADVAHIRAGLGAAGDRMMRENWIERAAVIAPPAARARPAPAKRAAAQPPVLKSSDAVGIMPAKGPPETVGPGQATASDAQELAPQNEATVESSAPAAAALTRRRVRRLPLPRFERPTATVGVITREPSLSNASADSEPALATRVEPKNAVQAPAQPQSAPAPIDQPRLIKSVSEDDVVLLAAALPIDVVSISNWSPAQVAEAGRLLGAPGRVTRENWVEQAAVLALGRETNWARRRAMVAEAPCVAPPAVDTWQRRPMVTAPATIEPPGSEAAASSPTVPPPMPVPPVTFEPVEVQTEASLDQRIARLQAEVARIRSLPEFSDPQDAPPAAARTEPTPATSDEAQDGQVSSPRLGDRLSAIAPPVLAPAELREPEPAPPLAGALSEDEQAPTETGDAADAELAAYWDGDGLDVEEAAVSIVAVDPTSRDDDRSESAVPSPPPLPSARRARARDAEIEQRAVPLEQRLQASMTSVRRRREHREEASRLPPPNYADTPEEASVQIIFRDADSPVDATGADGGDPRAPVPDEPRRATDDTSKSGLKRYLKALTGER
jgi:predicted flap endonuclease-1-like 5' DNA nuclease